MKKGIHIIVSIVVLMVFSLLFIGNRPAKDYDWSKEVIRGISYYPDGFTSGQIVKLPGRCQQFLISMQNNKERIVFEMMEKDLDTVILDEYTEIIVNDKKGIFYTYGTDGSIHYPSYGEGIMNGLAAPGEGENVLEWSSKKFDYRIFGTVSQKEMIQIAESVVE
jgi:hypothetical protein